MARIRILSWNIQVYGPTKYSHPDNGVALLNFIGALAGEVNANVVVVHEAMSSTCEQVAFNANESLEQAVGGGWEYFKVAARPQGDRESYAFLWRTGDGFAPVADPAGNPLRGLSQLPFPNNFSDRNGRAAAFVTFRTTDTNNYFTVTAYHAPPKSTAIWGLERLAQMPQLYSASPPLPAPAQVTGRLLAGDYNLDVNVQPDYSWLTNPVPAAPPPAAAGQGAGCAAATNGDTGLLSYNDASRKWGGGAWSANSLEYRRELAIDNVFWAAPPGAAAQTEVVDAIARMMTPAIPVRQAAEAFATVTAQGKEAFPHANDVQLPLYAGLNTAKASFLLYRYAVSDHLPVFLSLTI